MELDKLLTQVEKARRAPLQVCCRTPAGELITTTVLKSLPLRGRWPEGPKGETLP